jgi:hypothetical protein
MTCRGRWWLSPFAAIEGFENDAITRSRTVVSVPASTLLS